MSNQIRERCGSASGAGAGGEMVAQSTRVIGVVTVKDKTVQVFSSFEMVDP
jgi:hypothetical protein